VPGDSGTGRGSGDRAPARPPDPRPPGGPRHSPARLTSLPHVSPGMRHVFACLVHERAECVVDLIRNLQFFEPRSSVLLYDGSAGSLSEHSSTFEALGATVCQAPRRQTWGRLHESVFD